MHFKPWGEERGMQIFVEEPSLPIAADYCCGRLSSVQLFFCVLPGASPALETGTARSPVLSLGFQRVIGIPLQRGSPCKDLFEQILENTDTLPTRRSARRWPPEEHVCRSKGEVRLVFETTCSILTGAHDIAGKMCFLCLGPISRGKGKSLRCSRKRRLDKRRDEKCELVLSLKL